MYIKPLRRRVKTMKPVFAPKIFEKYFLKTTLANRLSTTTAIECDCQPMLAGGTELGP
jgi:hypothetical protein